ncbi:hypothetical protein BGZ60DRAFT_387639, partial [Tricladium varicosporioides]
LFCVSAAYACGRNAYKCDNPNANRDEMVSVTEEICNKLEESLCYYHQQDGDYCDDSGNNIASFKHMCEHWGDDWY